MALRIVASVNRLIRTDSNDSDVRLVDSTVVLRSNNAVEGFIKSMPKLKVKKIDEDGRVSLLARSVGPGDVEGIWVSECDGNFGRCFDDLAFDKKFHSAREYFARAGEVGFNVAALTLLRWVLTSNDWRSILKDWPLRAPKSLVFAGDVDSLLKKEDWEELTTPPLAQVFWCSITRLTIWTRIQIPNMPEDHAEIPEWVKLVPFEHMKVLTHFAFTLSGSENSSNTLQLMVFILPGRTGSKRRPLPGWDDPIDASEFKKWILERPLEDIKKSFGWLVHWPIQSESSLFWEDAFLRREHDEHWQNDRTVVLRSHEDVDTFINSVINSNDIAGSPFESPYKVDSIWVSQFRGNSLCPSRNPDYDKRFCAVRKYFAGAETIGFDVAAFDLFEWVASSQEADWFPATKFWRRKSVVIASDVDKYLTEIQWRRLAIPNVPEDHADIPKWVQLVPFEHMKSLTNFAFSLIGSEKNRKKLVLLMVYVLPGVHGSKFKSWDQYELTHCRPKSKDASVFRDWATNEKWKEFGWVVREKMSYKSWEKAFARGEHYKNWVYPETDADLKNKAKGSKQGIPPKVI